jgi:hypothetical protein
VRWPGKSSGAFGFVLIFLLRFLHQGKKAENKLLEKKNEQNRIIAIQVRHNKVDSNTKS